jgi:hypothetical protein
VPCLGEKQYYDTVRKWLENQGYYSGGTIMIKGKENYYQDIGTKQRRIDVAGVKNAGNKFEDDLEIVAIEVRDKPSVSDSDISDTSKYHNCAHKCYLAFTGQISSGIRQSAERENIGLLQLHNKTTPEVLHHPSPKEPTSYTEMIRFLESLQIVKCSICGCFFERFQRTEEGFHSSFEIVRASYFKTMKETEEDPLDLKAIKGLPNDFKILKYICYPCREEFYIAPRKISSIQKCHAYWDEESKGFCCLIGKTKLCTDNVYNSEQIVDHLQKKHEVPAESQIIKGIGKDKLKS